MVFEKLAKKKKKASIKHPHVLDLVSQMVNPPQVYTKPTHLLYLIPNSTYILHTGQGLASLI